MITGRDALIVGHVAAFAALIAASPTLAGGFSVREQSAAQQGMSFAGAAAGSTLSSMFWNSAVVTQFDGANTDANFSLIIPEAELQAKTGSTRLGAPGVSSSTDIGRDAIVPASYINYQFKNFDPNLYIGLGVNAPFGLVTKPDPAVWAGSEVGLKSRLFVVNLNPTLGYKLSNTLAIGVGLQVQKTEGEFKFATGSPGGPATYFDGDGFGVGATAGILWTPSEATSVGLGWRSAMDIELNGVFATNPGLVPGPAGAALNAGLKSSVDLKLPDIVTLSIKQAITPSIRAFGTVQWENWSRFKNLTVVAETPGATVLDPTTAAGQTIAVIDASWKDGWFFSLGGEYDVSSALTMRTGFGYEIAPTPDAQHRILGIPDSDRIWASIGASYKLNASTTIDVGYTHIFVEDAEVDRRNVAENVRIVADLDASADILAVGVRMKLGGGEALK